VHLVYYAHSYREPDKDINEFFQELMLTEGLTPSLDPPSDELNSAKPERHLRSTDGVITILPDRDPAPSSYIQYEIALGARAHKPMLVFVEDVLPDDLVSGALLQRRFSRRHLLREHRSHKHAISLFKTYIGSDPPPVYHPSVRRRSCLVIGMSGMSETQQRRVEDAISGLRYNPMLIPYGADCISYDHPYEEAVARAVLCIAFVEDMSPLEFYLLGAARSSCTPTVLLTRRKEYPFDPSTPREYQPRAVDLNDMDLVCQAIKREMNIFEQDYLEIEDQDKVQRYRTALMREGSKQGHYSHRARDVIFNLVANTVGDIDMSKDIHVDHVVGPVNIDSYLDHVTQTVRQAPAMPSDRREQLAGLIEELQTALKAAAARPADGERVARTADLVVTEATKEKPDKGFLGITAEGLKQAAKSVEDIAPAVLAVATRIIGLVSGASV
jgi:hypothetical protein